MQSMGQEVQELGVNQCSKLDLGCLSMDAVGGWVGG